MSTHGCVRWRRWRYVVRRHQRVLYTRGRLSATRGRAELTMMSGVCPSSSARSIILLTHLRAGVSCVRHQCSKRRASMSQTRAAAARPRSVLYKVVAAWRMVNMRHEKRVCVRKTRCAYKPLPSSPRLQCRDSARAVVWGEGRFAARQRNQFCMRVAAGAPEEANTANA